MIADALSLQLDIRTFRARKSESCQAVDPTPKYFQPLLAIEVSLSTRVVGVRVTQRRTTQTSFTFEP